MGSYITENNLGMRVAVAEIRPWLTRNIIFTILRTTLA